MNKALVKSLNLRSLGDGIPVIPIEAIGFYQQNCMICFDSQQHRSGVTLTVHHKASSDTFFQVLWDGDVTDDLRRAYRDLVKATEIAACAIALLIIRENTDFSAFEQAARGTTIDYYLCYKKSDELIFNYAARLEVSGILKEDASNTVGNRLKEKLKRLKPGLPCFIIVVEFSAPKSLVVEA
jgi:hypothetical protein